MFSDRPPSLDVAEKNILQQPGSTLKTLPPAESASEPARKVATPAASKASGQDSTLAARKAGVEQIEQAKRSADTSKAAAAKAANCERAKQAKRNLESGTRMSRTNQQGEREFIDDATRAQELKRVEAIVTADCRSS